jgi:kynurenine formamidase
MDESEIFEYFETLSNWGRWGEDDRIGALNLVTDKGVAAAASLISLGKSISCGRVMRFAPVPTPGEARIGTTREVRQLTPGHEFVHLMLRSGEAAPPQGPYSTRDWFAFGIHGSDFTHLDAPCHMIWNAKMYNGISASECTTEFGALQGNLDPVFQGLTSRGILVDGPDLVGKNWMGPGEMLTPTDLDKWMDRNQITVVPGDFLLVRTGRVPWEASGGSMTEGNAGLHPSCLPWLRANDVSLLLSDVINDAVPNGTSFMPIHLIGICALGLWLVDNADLEELSDFCRSSGRYSFYFSVVPLSIAAATGSLVNPTAIF